MLNVGTQWIFVPVLPCIPITPTTEKTDAMTRVPTDPSLYKWITYVGYAFTRPAQASYSVPGIHS